MLHGTQEEYDYHEQRAQQELAQASRSDDVAASRAHITLARLHQTRLELVSAVQTLRRKRDGRPIHHTDKES